MEELSTGLMAQRVSAQQLPPLVLTLRLHPLTHAFYFLTRGGSVLMADPRTVPSILTDPRMPSASVAH